MKKLVLGLCLIIVAFATQAYCSQTKDEPKYLENIYFALSNGISQINIKKLAEMILSNHGIQAEINVSL